MHLDIKTERKIDSYSPKGGLGQTARVILALMGVSHSPVKEHSQRMGLMCELIAKKMKLDEMASYFSGLLHDIGKLIQNYELFDGRNINGEEYVEVKKHAINAFLALKDIHLFIALCAGLHHALYQKGYGLTVDDFPKHLSLETVSKIIRIATIVSIADFIDAFTHRDTKIKDGSDAKAKSLKEMLYEKYTNDHLVVDFALEANKELDL